MGGVTMPKNIFTFFINFALSEKCAIWDSILGIYAYALEH
jgi:hypothetical protein